MHPLPQSPNSTSASGADNPAVAEAERLLHLNRGILDAALDAIVSIDDTGRVIEFNRAAESIFGYPREAALGRDMADLIIPPSQRERHRAGMQRLLQTGRSIGMLDQRLQVTAMRSDGAEFDVELVITRLSGADGRASFTAYLRDVSNARRMEQELEANLSRQRETLAYLEKSFNASPALMVMVRAQDARITNANPAFERASGYLRAEVLNKTTHELGLWEEPQNRGVFLETIRAQGSIRDFEARFRMKGGVTRTLLLNADLIQQDGLDYIFTVGLDITERRRRERVQAATFRISEAGRSEGDLNETLARVHAIVGELIPARNFYVALLDESAAEISFPYFVDETVPSPKPRRLGSGMTEQVLNTGKPLLASRAQILEHMRSKAPESAGFIEPPCAQWLGAPLLLDHRVLGAVVVQDYHNPAAYGADDLRLLTYVAEQMASMLHRQQMEKARMEAEAQYRSIFENAVEGLCQSTPDGCFINANPALARMLGRDSAQELRSLRWQEIYVDMDRHTQRVQSLASQDAIQDFQSEVRRPDGSHLWIAESVRAVRSPAGRLQHLESVVTDITAERSAAENLQRAKDEADAASRAKSAFLANISHELRTPLNGILGYAQILRRDAALNQKQREAIGVIHGSADHLLSLINDILDLAKIEARGIELQPVEFSLPEFASTVVEVFQPRALEKCITIETRIDPHLPRVVRADEQRLRQVVFNLLGNAIKFTEQGVVIFSIDTAGGGGVRFGVEDSGPGISAEDQERLFQPFTQLGDPRYRTGGSGLGLSISRSLVEQMGGTIRVESRPGLGSQFWFELALPVVHSDTPLQPRSPLPSRILGYEGQRRRILVADDHEDNRALLTDLLQPLGFEVTCAADGAQAVDLARHIRPDLVLLDLRMPKLDGLAAARLIRENVPTMGNPLPVIIGISASAFFEDRQSFLNAGCADFLAKPFREQQILGMIAHHLGLRWIHDHPAGEETQFLTREAVGSSSHMTPPDAARIKDLIELANRGDVLGVRRLAESLPAQNDAWRPFSQALVNLASRYKVKAIRQFLAPFNSLEPGRQKDQPPSP